MGHFTSRCRPGRFLVCTRNKSLQVVQCLENTGNFIARRPTKSALAMVVQSLPYRFLSKNLPILEVAAEKWMHPGTVLLVQGYPCGGSATVCHEFTLLNTTELRK
ncbi:hypothetical protein GE21DRAFT_1216798 [Neurospora crassa]|nr:hypothetical protein GE21DRAFT_1216798 [Neurospora crassa]